MRHKNTIKFFDYDKVTLPGDSHVALLLRMTEYFVRNITSVCLLKSNSTIYILSLRYPVQRTLCHCERSVAIPRKGNLVIKPTQDTFVLAWRKRRKQA